ncbi:sphingosine kinase [Malassezia vespertilionis]|uniref:Lcb4p n=1 Tax=Malassezia vespertilionis TaxID=2020962 RepID=A0A2N1J718_9BASI|nr:sphingosine kinase [Malassezia vespertilionis]PKI82347.1 Lcb4p [Malassezia vespertilionis]WFD08128.1 sphingosine kinase [Malassezia vespertilionis]
MQPREGAALHATVHDLGAQLVLQEDTLRITLESVSGDWLHVPVELVLDASVAIHADACVLTLNMLAPKQHTHSMLSCFGKRKVKVTHVLTRAQWRERGSDPTVARLFSLKIKANVPVASHAAALAWCKSLLGHAYKDVKQGRNALVICNPKGGQGRGESLCKAHVEPLLQAARCTVTTYMTQKRHDAFEYVYHADLSSYQVLVCVGGDGTAHEIVNAASARPDASDALQIPLAVIPTGSGNGMYVSIHGVGTGFNVPLACLSAIKGRPHAQQLCTVTQATSLYASAPNVPYPMVQTAANGESYVQFYSFLSQAIGLMADVDLGTEAFRWIGDLRFALGYVVGAIRNRRCDIDVDVVFGRDGGPFTEPFEAPKGAFDAQEGEAHTLRYNSILDPIPEPKPVLDWHECTTMPREHEMEVWTRIKAAVSSLYSGKMPYVARSLKAFPYAHPADGYLDVLIQTQNSSVVEKISATAHGERGKHIHDNNISYFKVRALRVTPHRVHDNAQHYLSIDGEMMPYGPFQVEISPLFLRVLTLSDGEWHAPIHGPHGKDI